MLSAPQIHPLERMLFDTSLTLIPFWVVIGLAKNTVTVGRDEGNFKPSYT
jgi:hypothetical protein